MPLDPALYPWWQEDAPDMEDTMPEPETPSYYQLETGDLYDLFVSQRGLDVVRQHLEMAAVEYLWRCRRKGQYLRDLEKTRVILDRLIDMANHEAPSIPEAALDDALSVLGQHGWSAVPPPLPPREGSNIAAVDHVGVYDRLMAEQSAHPTVDVEQLQREYAPSRQREPHEEG